MMIKSYFKFILQVLVFAGILALGSLFWLRFLDYKLTSYELSTVNGSLNYFSQLISDDEFEKIYELENKVIENYNDKAEYLKYLSDYLDAVDEADISYEFVYDDKDNDIHYYRFYYNNIYFSDLALYPIANDKTSYTVSFINSQVLKIEFPDPYQDTLFNGKKTTAIQEVNGTYSLLAKLKEYDYLPTPTYVVEIANYIDLDYQLSIDPDKYIYFKNKGEDVITVAYKADEKTNQELKELGQNFAEAYSKFISRDGIRWDMLKYVNWDSDLYRSLNSFDNQFFSSHDSYEFNNFKFSDIGLLQKNFYTITIDYDYTVINGDQVKVYPTKFQLIISDYLNGYKIFDMNVLDSN